MPRLILLLALAASVLAQPSPDPDPRLANVPAALREKTVAALQETDEAKRVLLVRDLGPATDFLLALLEREPSARVRREIVTRLLRHDEPPVRQALERLIASDPDASVSILALEQLRLPQSRANLRLLEQRLPAATSANRTPLALEHERTVALARGARLPAFFQTPPPIFSLKPAASPSGSSPSAISDRAPQGPRSLFARSSCGFAVVEADQSTLKVSYYDPDLKPLYDYTLRK